MRTPIATPRLMAGDTPQTGATTTRLVRRRHGHRVRRAPLKFARRPSRGDASQTLEVPQGKETKRRWRHVRPGFLSDHRRAASARDHGAKPSSPLPTHTADVTTTTRGAGGSSRRCTTDRKSAAMRDFGLRMARPGLEPGTPRFSVVLARRSSSVDLQGIRTILAALRPSTLSRILRAFSGPYGRRMRPSAFSWTGVRLPSAGLWSRRPRVRVPSLTLFAPANGDLLQWCRSGASKRGEIRGCQTPWRADWRSRRPRCRAK